MTAVAAATCRPIRLSWAGNGSHFIRFQNLLGAGKALHRHGADKRTIRCVRLIKKPSFPKFAAALSRSATASGG